MYEHKFELKFALMYLSVFFQRLVGNVQVEVTSKSS